MRNFWLLYFVYLFIGYSVDSKAAPIFSERTLARVIRTERRFPMDFEACKNNLYGSGAQQGELHDRWGCVFGRMYWILPYSVESWGVRKAYIVDHANLGPGCVVSLDFASNGFGIFIDAGHMISRKDAAACIDLAVRTPGSGIVSPGLQVLDTFEGNPPPGPDYPGDPVLYEDHLVGEVATEIELSYQPCFDDFKSRMVFRGKTMSGCKPGIGCVAISEGSSTLAMSGGPESGDFDFGRDGFSSSGGAGCQASFGFHSDSHELEWTEAYVAYSRVFPPLPPGKHKVLDCAKDPGLIPRIRVFRYHPPYQPLPRS